jgi:hypothetical protein
LHDAPGTYSIALRGGWWCIAAVAIVMVCCTATLHTPSHPKYDPEDKDVIMIRHSASHTTASILICQDPRIQNRPTQEGESVEGMKSNE